MKNKITKVNIKNVSPGSFFKLNQVWVETEDNNSEVKIFEYYPDEIQFNEQELIGLTINEAVTLKSHKDIDYLMI